MRRLWFSRISKKVLTCIGGGALALGALAANAGTVVSGVNITVNADDTVSVNSSGSSAYPGGVGAAGSDLAYINGWSVTGGTINWTDTNNTLTLRMDSAGIDVLNANGVANSNGNKTGSVTLAGSTTLGAALRGTYGLVTNQAFTSVAVQNGGVSFDIAGTVTILGPNPDIAVSVAESSDPVVAGSGADNLTYTVTVQNITPNDATGVVVAAPLTLPSGAVLSSSATSQGSYTVGTGNWTVGSLAGNASATLTLTMTVGASTANAATISTTASLSSLNETDGDAANDSDAASTTVSTSADLSIAKTDSADPAIAGNGLSYTITVNNAGPSDAASVVATDNLPAGVTLVSTSGCAEDPAGAPTCSLGTIASGGSAQYTVAVTVDADTTGTLSNSASVTATTSDPAAGNNTTSENTTVEAHSDLSVVVTGPPAIVTPGLVTFNVEVSNAGPSDALNVIASDAINAPYISVETSGCNGDPAGFPDCQIGTLGAGGTANYSITFEFDRLTADVIYSVSVDSDSTDSVRAENAAQAGVSATAEAIPTLGLWGLMLLIAGMLGVASVSHGGGRRLPE